jgi:hypothetical protein
MGPSPRHLKSSGAPSPARHRSTGFASRGQASIGSRPGGYGDHLQTDPRHGSVRAPANVKQIVSPPSRPLAAPEHFGTVQALVGDILPTRLPLICRPFGSCRLRMPLVDATGETPRPTIIPNDLATIHSIGTTTIRERMDNAAEPPIPYQAMRSLP